MWWDIVKDGIGNNGAKTAFEVNKVAREVAFHSPVRDVGDRKNMQLIWRLGVSTRNKPIGKGTGE